MWGYQHNYIVFDDGSEWTLFSGFNTCESNDWVLTFINIVYNNIYIY